MRGVSFLRRCLILCLLITFAAMAAEESDLRRAQQLAWDKHFAESEALYRRILAEDPQSTAARLGLARVVMWQGRYGEAISMFRALSGNEAREGLATALYWSGELRAALREYREVLRVDPQRETARRAIDEIRSAARPWQRVTITGSSDDQPLRMMRGEAAYTFFSDPLTKWSVRSSLYHLDASRAGTSSGESFGIDNETKWAGATVSASLGLFAFPDGVRRPIGRAAVQRNDWTLAVERREEIATSTSLESHAASTGVTLRWYRQRRWLAAAEGTWRRYMDGNRGHALVAWAVAPIRRGAWTAWMGGSGAFRDTRETRFRPTAISSTLNDGIFRYHYRGEYDPYWTPESLREARLVVAVERQFSWGAVKLHADGGAARDRRRGFGPDAGAQPLPQSTFDFSFTRDSRPYRAGLSADLVLTRSIRLQAGAERSVSIDYRSTSFHAGLVRRH